jgi:hypothetical protein
MPLHEEVAVKFWSSTGIFVAFLCLCGCGKPAVQLLEVERKTVSSGEAVHMNNCGGAEMSEQTIQKTFATGLDLNPQSEADYAAVASMLSGKYGQYTDAARSQLLKAPPGTNMEFALNWSEDVRNGQVVAGETIGDYFVHIPIGVELVSSRDLGCESIGTDDMLQGSSHVREALIISFKDGASGVWTEHEYAGRLTFLVQGTGQASGAQQSDAFYVFTDFNGQDIEPMRYAEFYNFTLWINGEPADTLVEPIPPYNPYHVYQVTIDAPGGRLVFAVGDVYVVDNDGYYTILILK